MSTTRMRKRQSRKIAKKDQRKTIRIYTEGLVTEPCYIQILKRKYRNINIDWVSADSGKSPVSLIRAAKKYKNSNKSGDLADEIWCIWDVDNYSTGDIARFEDMANAAGIRNAISNPCFELWLVLHEKMHAAHISLADAQRLAKATKLVSGKDICCCQDWMFDQMLTANNRAEKLSEDHTSVGNKTCSNPSSGMHKFLKSIDGKLFKTPTT